MNQDDKEVNHEREFVQAAFGHKNRHHLLENYFADIRADALNPASAWSHVYRLLLWIDQTTGLAHSYESDKCQPGKPWYGRSLAFHAWVSDALRVPPAQVREVIDWMFQKAARELATEVLERSAGLARLAAQQRRSYEGRGFPAPGEDPGLIEIVRQVLGKHLTSDPSPQQWRDLVQRLRQYLLLDNKRKNLLGEGFEDTLSALITRTCPDISVPTRVPLHEIPGFKNQRKGDKNHKVDLAVIGPNLRTLVSVKWSVRADREKQFVTDYNEYVFAESDSKPFEYVFVTNEFDPARLARACDKLAGNAHMFSRVVHVNTDALRATYGGAASESSMGKVLSLIAAGRLISLQNWLAQLRQ